jgi:sugar lactone lactonase YvrE
MNNPSPPGRTPPRAGRGRARDRGRSRHRGRQSERSGSASDLFHPNGMAVTPDGQTIVMRETHNGHVTSFSIDEDGGLFNKKTFAGGLQLPDGLCLDAAGAVWRGCLSASEFLSVTEGGTIAHRVRVPAPYWALAPMLGGPDRHTLYLLAADTDPARAQQDDSHGYLYRMRVDVPGAGCP